MRGGWRALLGTCWAIRAPRGSSRAPAWVVAPPLTVSGLWSMGAAAPPPLGVMAQLYNFEELFTKCPYEPPRVLLALGYVSVNLTEFGQHEGR